MHTIAPDNHPTQHALVQAIVTMIYVVFAIIELVYRVIMGLAGLIADAIVWVLHRIIPESME